MTTSSIEAALRLTTTAAIVGGVAGSKVGGGPGAAVGAASGAVVGVAISCAILLTAVVANLANNESQHGNR